MQVDPLFAAVPRALSPTLAEDIRQLQLSNHEIDLLQKFASDGFVTIDLEIDDFERLARDIIDELAPRYDDGPRLADAWRISGNVKQLACLEQVAQTLELLFGRKPFPFQTLNFQRGSEQIVHSDTIHFDSIPGGYMAGVWIALEDIDNGNGPLFYFRGSHRLPAYTYADMGLKGSSKAGSHDYYATHYEPFMQRVVERLQLQPEEAYPKRGQALIWSANLLHGGSPIRQAGRSRHSLVTHYYFENCIYYTPMWSDPALGRIYYRHPYDVGTGRPARSSYCGSPFQPPLAVRAKEWLQNQMRHYTTR